MSRMPTAILLLGAILLVVSPAPAAAAGAKPTRTLAVIPFYTPERMWQLYSPFVSYLGSHTGESWELKLYASHDEMVRAFCAGEVDVALLGPVPLGRVNVACGAEPLLVALGRDGKPVYRAMLLTSDPAVASIEALRGRKVGFFRGSTAAHVVPLHLLRDAGLAAGSFEEVFFESQDKVLTALLERKIAGAGVKEALYRRFEQEPVRLLRDVGGAAELRPRRAPDAATGRPGAPRRGAAAAAPQGAPGGRGGDAGLGRRGRQRFRRAAAGVPVGGAAAARRVRSRDA